MSKFNQEKTVSANSKGVIISYGDVKKHQFVRYDSYVRKIQIEGTVRYQKLESFEFNETQQRIFSTLVYGFEVIPDEQIKKLPAPIKKRIVANYAITNKLLNRWKQEIINEMVDGFLSKMFPKSKVTKQMIGLKGYDDTLKSTISFKELGISERSIANKLIEFDLLPKNFFNLA
jgi:hypothetical protein